MSTYQKESYYVYTFSNGHSHTMTPKEAHLYAHRVKTDILAGPGYIKGKKEKTFDGFGWHSSLQMHFKGPAHYRQYLKENSLYEAQEGDRKYLEPDENYRPPLWTPELIKKCVSEYGMEIGSVLSDALLTGKVLFPDGTRGDDTPEEMSA